MIYISPDYLQCIQNSAWPFVVENTGQRMCVTSMMLSHQVKLAQLEVFSKTLIDGLKCDLTHKVSQSFVFLNTSCYSILKVPYRLHFIL